MLQLQPQTLLPKTLSKALLVRFKMSKRKKPKKCKDNIITNKAKNLKRERQILFPL